MKCSLPGSNYLSGIILAHPITNKNYTNTDTNDNSALIPAWTSFGTEVLFNTG